MAVLEKLAQEMKAELTAGALSYGSHQLEREQTYYSHGFALTSRLVTNKGLIKMSDKNINFVQILQSN